MALTINHSSKPSSKPTDYRRRPRGSSQRSRRRKTGTPLSQAMPSALARSPDGPFEDPNMVPLEGGKPRKTWGKCGKMMKTAGFMGREWEIQETFWEMR